MEKLKIKDKTYLIKSIESKSPHVLKIRFSDEKPSEYGDLFLYTSGDMLAATLQDFSTVYRQEGDTVWLSNDGSVYEEPKETKAMVIELTLDDLKAQKVQEVNSACANIIYKGVDVHVSDGIEHFSLSEMDQINLFGLQAMIAAGREQIPYHCDGHPCKFYTAEDIKKLIETSILYVTYHTTYTSALRTWIKSLDTEEELLKITYGADIPEKYQSEVLRKLVKEMER